MNLFSERYGYKPVREALQIESIDPPLRNTLWSVLQEVYWHTARFSNRLRPNEYHLSDNAPLRVLCRSLWVDLFKRPVDTLHNDWTAVRQELRDKFFGGE